MGHHLQQLLVFRAGRLRLLNTSHTKASIQDVVLSSTSKGTQVCAFHRTEDYCIYFVPIYFWLACPFKVLTQKRELENVTWTQKAEKVFIMLKGAFTSEKVELDELGFSLIFQKDMSNY